MLMILLKIVGYCDCLRLNMRKTRGCNVMKYVRLEFDIECQLKIWNCGYGNHVDATWLKCG